MKWIGTTKKWWLDGRVEIEEEEDDDDKNSWVETDADVHSDPNVASSGHRQP